MSLKVLQISTVCGSGSVGRITVDIYHTLEQNKDQGRIAYGRRNAPEDVDAFCFGSKLDMGLHVLSTFFKGEHGFASAGQTKRLIEEIRKWDPDVIHLHNIHGFVLQVELLFAYLKEAGKPVVWTLHDCWSYTGHCAFYDYTGCRGWETGCKDCKEYQKTYPYALFKNNTRRNFERKQAAFTGVPNLTIVTPSDWLRREVKRSFLKDYPVLVIPNGIDQSQFKPIQSDLRERLGLEDKFVILGVANVWERRKGLEYFTELAGRLPQNMQIILIGLEKKQRKHLPDTILGLPRTSSVRELAEYYSMADVFVNATLEDNFPTTNLEALSCGTPVITFDTGGSPESLDESCGRIVPRGDVDALLEAIYQEQADPKQRADCLKKAEQYEKYDRFQEYVELYHRLAGQGE
jgi:glycosyltransferase involved in cell wall biosynthesis